LEEKLICSACTHKDVCVHRDTYIYTHEVCMAKLAEEEAPFKFTLRCKHFKEGKPKLSIRLLV